MSMVRMLKTNMDPAGIWKVLVRCLSMVLACWRKNVCCWATAVMRKMPEAPIGPILIMVFNSSTLWTVFNLHKLDILLSSSSVTIAALSKNLYQFWRQKSNLVKKIKIQFNFTPFTIFSCHSKVIFVEINIFITII